MKINCFWEHNGEDTLLYATDFIGAYARGESLEAAKAKLPREIRSYRRWLGEDSTERAEIVILEEKASALAIRDADSDAIFSAEREPLSRTEYERLKALALRSAANFHTVYAAIPDKSAVAAPPRKTFYGQVPRSAEEMYAHTKSVNAYYFAEIGVDADNEGDILSCRERGFEALEAKPNFLQNAVVEGSYGELWSLRKLLRRFLWHDRIHAKAMCRMAATVFGSENMANPFCFDLEDVT